jgi:hypothetical protein
VIGELLGNVAAIVVRVNAIMFPCEPHSFLASMARSFESPTFAERGAIILKPLNKVIAILIGILVAANSGDLETRRNIVRRMGDGTRKNVGRESRFVRDPTQSATNKRYLRG